MRKDFHITMTVTKKTYSHEFSRMNFFLFIYIYVFIFFLSNFTQILKFHLITRNPWCEWWYLTHWGRVTHICVVKLTIIGSDNGLSPPGRRQAIIWTNAGRLLIGPLGTNFSEILIGIQTFSFKKMHLKISPAKWRPFCLGLTVLTGHRPLPEPMITESPAAYTVKSLI